MTHDGGKAIVAAIEAVRAHGVETDEPEFKHIPAGFDVAAPGADLLRYKGLMVKSGKKLYPDAIFDARIVDFIADLCAAMFPLNRYLAERVFDTGNGT